jgi:hypothetical protein
MKNTEVSSKSYEEFLLKISDVLDKVAFRVFTLLLLLNFVGFP